MLVGAKHFHTKIQSVNDFSEMLRPYQCIFSYQEIKTERVVAIDNPFCIMDY